VTFRKTRFEKRYRQQHTCEKSEREVTKDERNTVGSDEILEVKLSVIMYTIKDNTSLTGRIRGKIRPPAMLPEEDQHAK
jgi:hypothetical protein